MSAITIFNNQMYDFCPVVDKTENLIELNCWRAKFREKNIIEIIENTSQPYCNVINVTQNLILCNVKNNLPFLFFLRYCEVDFSFGKNNNENLIYIAVYANNI